MIFLKRLFGQKTEPKIKYEDINNIRTLKEDFGEDEYITSTDIINKYSLSSVFDYHAVTLFRSYELMLYEPILATALSIYTDDTCMYNSEIDSSVIISATKKQYKQYEVRLRKFVDENYLEESFIDWLSNGLLYGELPIRVKGEYGKGIVSIYDYYHPSDVYRIELGADVLGYYIRSENILVPPWEIVYFRIPGMRFRSSILNQTANFEEIYINYRDKLNAKLFRQIGKSIFFDVRDSYRLYRMAIDSLVLTRLTRTPETRIFKVSFPLNRKVRDVIDRFKRIFKRNYYYDMNKGIFQAINNPINFGQDVIIPVDPTSKEGDLSIDKIGGEAEIHWLQDVKMLEDKLFCGIHLPRALFGYYSDMPSDLAGHNVKMYVLQYANALLKCRRSWIGFLKRLFQIHLSYYGVNPDVNRFDIKVANEGTGVLSSMYNFNTDKLKFYSEFNSFLSYFLGKVNMDMDFKYYVKYVLKNLNLFNFNVEEFFKENNTFDNITDEIKTVYNELSEISKNADYSNVNKYFRDFKYLPTKENIEKWEYDKKNIDKIEIIDHISGK